MSVKPIPRGFRTVQPYREYGDRHGVLESENGIQYCIATHIEDVGPEEIARRMRARHSSTA